MTPEGTAILLEPRNVKSNFLSVAGKSWLPISFCKREHQAFFRAPLAIFAFLAPMLASGETTFIPAGAVWKYLDTGVDQGVAWRQLQFNDTAWSSGPAKLGYGEGDEATVLSFGPDPNNKHITYYFRHAFNIGDVSGFTNLQMRLRRDDGAVVYLNGTEVFRSNISSGTISFGTLARIAAVDDGAIFIPAGLNPALLRTGLNVMAVEVHQNTPDSSDLTFALELKANVPFVPPLITATPGTAPAPLLEFKFNGAGALAHGTGIDTNGLALTLNSSPADLHSRDAEGVSGLPGDRAFDNSMATAMGSLGSGGGLARIPEPLEGINDLRSLTLQGWFRAQDMVIDRLARLITNQSGDSGFLLLGTGGNLTLEINNAGTTSSGSAYMEIGEWVFFAVAYDGTGASNNVRFYKATRTTPVALVQTRSLNQGAARGNSQRVSIGNLSNISRPFDGWLDNIRVFGSKTDSSGALSVAQLESYRNKDVQNAAEEVSLLVARLHDSIRLSWPSYPGGFRLEFSESLEPGAAWLSVKSATRTLGEGENFLVGASEPHRYFRLVRP
jgi:hypothetical protein